MPKNSAKAACDIPRLNLMAFSRDAKDLSVLFFPVDSLYKTVEIPHRFTHGMSTRSNANYRRLLAGMIEAGISMHSWAQANGFPPATVYAAAKGTRSGVKAVRIRKLLNDAISNPK